MENIRDFIHYIEEFNTWSVVLRIFLAVLAGGVIGTERGRHGSPAGFRTHILVCLGAAMTSLCSLYVSTVSGAAGDIFRISASVVSGIGFLGAGIILVKNNSTVAGLTTAAGMWVTATIGVAFGYGFYGGALLGTVVCVITAALLTKIEHKRKQSIHFYVEISDLDNVQAILDKIEAALEKDIVFEATPAKSGTVGNIGFEVTTSYKHPFESIKPALNEIDGISFVVQG